MTKSQQMGIFRILDVEKFYRPKHTTTRLQYFVFCVLNRMCFQEEVVENWVFHIRNYGIYSQMLPYIFKIS